MTPVIPVVEDCGLVFSGVALRCDDAGVGVEEGEKGEEKDENSLFGCLPRAGGPDDDGGGVRGEPPFGRTSRGNEGSGVCISADDDDDDPLARLSVCTLRANGEVGGWVRVENVPLFDDIPGISREGEGGNDCPLLEDNPPLACGLTARWLSDDVPAKGCHVPDGCFSG